MSNEMSILIIFLWVGGFIAGLLGEAVIGYVLWSFPTGYSAGRALMTLRG